MNWFGKKKPPVFIDMEEVIDSLTEMPPGRLDTYSESWLYVMKFVTDELSVLRQKNDNVKLDVAATAELRGQIKFAKKLLALHAKADKVALGKPTAF